jgi:hypothetical protein
MLNKGAKAFPAIRALFDKGVGAVERFVGLIFATEDENARRLTGRNT